MQKIVAFNSTNYSDKNILALGTRLQNEVKSADIPITGSLKQELYRLMEFNTGPFERDLQRFPDVMADCKKIRALFDKELTYRQFIDVTLHMVETAETALLKENPTLLSGFPSTINHEDLVKAICDKFPKICQIPVYGPKGLFSLELLWRPILEATLKKDRRLEAVVWPFAVCPEWTEADGRSVGPSSVGRHDRIHLRLFANELSTLSSKLSFEKVVKGINQCIENTMNPESLRHLSMIIFYGLHEALPRFFLVLEPMCHDIIRNAFLDRIIEVLGPESNVNRVMLRDMLRHLSSTCQDSRRAKCFVWRGGN